MSLEIQEKQERLFKDYQEGSLSLILLLAEEKQLLFNYLMRMVGDESRATRAMSKTLAAITRINAEWNSLPAFRKRLYHIARSLITRKVISCKSLAREQ